MPNHAALIMRKDSTAWFADHKKQEGIKMADLVCVGLTTLDILGRTIESIPEKGKTQLIEQIRLTPAGTAAGAALNAAKLGMHAALVAAIGQDDMGSFVESALKKIGVDTSHMQHRTDAPTSSTILVIDSDGHRPNWHAVGAAILLEIDAKLREFIVSAPYIHWAAGALLFLDGQPGADILKSAKERGATVSCDFIAPNEGTLSALEAILPYCDYFLPSMEEAMEIAGTNTPEETSAFYMARGAKSCVFKWGSRGCWLADGKRQMLIPAFKVAAVDTTGCGDAFCGGFITAVSKGWDIEKSCRFASATAALVATGLGSDAGVVNLEETIRAMETLPVIG
jgi:sugar/nucleoside kinase (ribokinase family)